ncbi:uncharacterized protein DS421_2g56320 [Arachis hypogaea]|nr:uncharacterized protein DS421_2g56320 [Arachis hypogaea]
MEDDPNCLYRLDGVTHIVGVVHLEPHRCISNMRQQHGMMLDDRIVLYLQMAGLYHLARLNESWFWLDKLLVSAFVERWRPETHTFHMPFGECTIILQDVAYHLGLLIDGQCMCRIANRDVVKLAGPLQLLQSWIFWRFPDSGRTDMMFSIGRWPRGYQSSLSDKGARVANWILRIDLL